MMTCLLRTCLVRDGPLMWLDCPDVWLAVLCDDEPAASRDAGCISASIDACSPALNVAKGETSVWCCQKCWGGCNMTGPCPLRVAVSGSSSAGESVVRRFVDCLSKSGRLKLEIT